MSKISEASQRRGVEIGSIEFSLTMPFIGYACASTTDRDTAAQEAKLREAERPLRGSVRQVQQKAVMGWLV
jgi:hypothetical protein